MSIPEEAIEAAAKVILRSFRPAHPAWDEWTEDGQEMWKDYAREALESASPHILKNMRPMTLVEIAQRDRPESMERARGVIRAARKEERAEAIRRAKEDAWLIGYAAGELDGAFELNDHEEPGRRNPYRKEPK